MALFKTYLSEDVFRIESTTWGHLVLGGDNAMMLLPNRREKYTPSLELTKELNQASIDFRLGFVTQYIFGTIYVTSNGTTRRVEKGLVLSYAPPIHEKEHLFEEMNWWKNTS